MTPLTPELLRAALPLLHHGESLCCFFLADDGALMQCQLVGPGAISPETTVRLKRWHDPGMSAYSIDIGRVFIYDGLAADLADIGKLQQRAPRPLSDVTARRQAVAVFVELARKRRQAS